MEGDAQDLPNPPFPRSHSFCLGLVQLSFADSSLKMWSVVSIANVESEPYLDLI